MTDYLRAVPALLVCLVGGFLLASLAVRYVLRRTLPKTAEDKANEVANIQKPDKAEREPWLDDPAFWIGLCEYVLVVIFVVVQQYTALGIVFAAKGFARKDSQEDKNTYFLLGTLLNVCIALLFGLVLREWWRRIGILA